MSNDALLIVLSIGFILLIAFVWWSIREYFIAGKLHQSGVLLEASVIELEQLWWTRSLSHYVVYKFDPVSSSQSLIRRQAISWLHRGRLKTGGNVMVRYLPTNPQISRLADADKDNTSRDTSILRALAVLLILVAFLKS